MMRRSSIAVVFTLLQSGFAFAQLNNSALGPPSTGDRFREQVRVALVKLTQNADYFAYCPGSNSYVGLVWQTQNSAIPGIGPYRFVARLPIYPPFDEVPGLTPRQLKIRDCERSLGAGTANALSIASNYLEPAINLIDRSLVTDTPACITRANSEMLCLAAAASIDTTPPISLNVLIEAKPNVTERLVEAVAILALATNEQILVRPKGQYFAVRPNRFAEIERGIQLTVQEIIQQHGGYVQQQRDAEAAAARKRKAEEDRLEQVLQGHGHKL